MDMPEAVWNFPGTEDGDLSSDDVARAWTTAARWIKEMVRIEPTIMRQVAQATFGDLGSWLERGPKNVGGVCGCLVGTTALKLAKARSNTYSIKRDAYGAAFCSPEGDYTETFEVVAALTFQKAMEGEAEAAGMAASTLGQALGNTPAVALIKAEILRCLALRRRRVAAARKGARTVAERRHAVTQLIHETAGQRSTVGV